MRIRSIFPVFLGTIAVAAPAQAAETVSYSYDALGRLTATTTSGGPQSGVAVGTSYDPAGNRTSYTVTGASAALRMTPFAGERQLARAEAAEKRRALPRGG